MAEFDEYPVDDITAGIKRMREALRDYDEQQTPIEVDEFHSKESQMEHVATEVTVIPGPETRTIQLDRERTIRSDFAALVRFKKATGLSVMNGDLAETSLDEETSCAFIWAHLVHEDPELTVDQVAQMMTVAKLTECIDIIADLMGDPVP